MKSGKSCALVLMILAAAPPVAARAAGLCTAGETPVLSCPVAGGKVLSLCAAGLDGDADGLKLQYRFGEPGAPELVYPDRPASPKGRFFLSSTPFAGGGEERIRFRSGAYDYVVFQRDVSGNWHEDGTRDHHQDEGVVVERDGKVVGRRLCAGPIENDGFPKMYDNLETEDGDQIDIPCCGEK